MTTDNPTRYELLAELIYAENPGNKETLNQGAQLVIESLKDALTVELSAEDSETVFAIIAAIAADILTTTLTGVSEKVNIIFNIHSLAAGAAAGEIDLGDTSEAKGLAAIMREAKARERAAAESGSDVPGQYL